MSGEDLEMLDYSWKLVQEDVVLESWDISDGFEDEITAYARHAILRDIESPGEEGEWRVYDWVAAVDGSYSVRALDSRKKAPGSERHELFDCESDLFVNEEKSRDETYEFSGKMSCSLKADYVMTYEEHLELVEDMGGIDWDFED